MSLNHCRRIDPGIAEQLHEQQRHASLSSFISIPWESRNWQVSKHGKTWNNHEEHTRSNETLWHVILGHHHVMRSFGGAEISACSSITNPRANSLIQCFHVILSLSPPSSVQSYRSLYTVFALKRVSEHALSWIQPLWNLHSCYPCSSKMRSWSCSCRGVLFRATRSKCTSNPVTSLPFCDEVVIHAVEDHFVRRFIKT